MWPVILKFDAPDQKGKCHFSAGGARRFRLMNVQNKSAKVCVAILFFMVLAEPISAEQLSIGTEDVNAYPLFGHEKGAFTGFAGALFEAFSNQTGHTIVVKAFPIKQLPSAVVQEQIQLTFPDNPHWSVSEKKGQRILYSLPVLSYKEGVLILPSHKGKPIQRMGVLEGLYAWEYKKDIEAGRIELVFAKSSASLIKLVLDEKVDGAYFNVAIAKQILKSKYGNENLLMFNQALPYSADFYYLSTIQKPEIVSQFNQFLTKNHELVKRLKQQFSLAP